MKRWGLVTLAVAWLGCSPWLLQQAYSQPMPDGLPSQTGDAVSTTTAGALKARLSDLVEVIPDSDSTDIDLIGVEPEPSPLRVGSPIGFHSPGTILRLNNERDNWFNSETYIALAEGNVAIEVQNTESDGMPLSGGDESIDRFGKAPDDSAISLETRSRDGDTIWLRLASTRFFNGKLDGKAATLVLVAQTWNDGQGFSPGASVNVMISLYELQAHEVDLPGLFVRMAHFVTSSSYCNTDVALLQELAIPLPAIYIYSGKKVMCAAPSRAAPYGASAVIVR